MIKRKRNMVLTEAQKNYRNEMIKIKHKNVKPINKPLPEPKSFLQEKIMYLNNCIFWIDQFDKGETDKERLSHVIKAIEQMCQEIKVFITTHERKTTMNN